jgi:hypothetical protein
MRDLNPPPPATRAPRTFEMHGEEWVDTSRPQARRAPWWLIVPALLAATTAMFVVVFAVFAALFTGGLLAARRRFLDATARLRSRFAEAIRR